MIRNSLGLLLAAVLLSVTPAVGAAEKQPAKPAAAKKSAKPAGKPKAAKKPGPVQRVYAARHGAWILQCFRNAQKRIFCNMGQVRTYKLGKKDLAEYKAKKFAGSPRLVMLITGTSLGEIVIFASPSRWAKDSRLIGRVDKAKGFGIDTPADREVAPITPKDAKALITAFERGNRLRVQFLPSVGDVQTLTFSLRGFSAGMRAMRAVIKKYAKTEPKPQARKATPKSQAKPAAKKSATQ